VGRAWTGGPPYSFTIRRNSMEKKEVIHDGLPDVLSIDNLANGAVYEMVGEAFARLATNIADPNTEATQKRKITIIIDAKPYKDRSGAELSIKVENKLAGLRPVDGTMFVAKRNGEFLAFSRNTKQEALQFDMGAGQASSPTAKPS
jgi:hypothetical protein